MELTSPNSRTPKPSPHSSLAGRGSRPLALLLLLTLLLPACSRSPSQTREQRAEAAKALFDRTTKTFHIPSAEAKGAEKKTLQKQAAAGYEELLKKYPDQTYWAAQALRNLGNIRATQGKIDEAVQDYAGVEKKYPRQRWEVLMSWKSAADLLWEAGRHSEAKPFYEKIIAQYDRPESSQVEKTIVRGSKMKLGGGDLPK